MKTVCRSDELSDAELSQYRAEGYVRVGRVLGDDELVKIRAEEARFREAARVPNPERNRNLSITQICPYSSTIREFALKGVQVGWIRQLVGPNLLLWFTQFVTKMPDEATRKSEFPWHQDNGYIAIEPSNNVTIWIALDDVDENNGCLWLAPRSHLNGLLPHHQINGSGFLDTRFDAAETSAVMQAGEAIIFSGLTFHRSKLNSTRYPRRALVIEYCDMEATCRFDNSDIYIPGAKNGDRIPVIKHPGTVPVCGELPLPNDGRAQF